MTINTEFYDFIKVKRAHDSEAIFIRASLVEGLVQETSGVTRVLTQSADDGYLVLESIKDILIALRYSSVKKCEGHNERRD